MAQQHEQLRPGRLFQTSDPVIAEVGKHAGDLVLGPARGGRRGTGTEATAGSASSMGPEPGVLTKAITEQMGRPARPLLPVEEAPDDEMDKLGSKPGDRSQHHVSKARNMDKTGKARDVNKTGKTRRVYKTSMTSSGRGSQLWGRC